MLVKTSNPSSGELQNHRDMEGKPLYARMAEMVAKWGEVWIRRAATTRSVP